MNSVNFTLSISEEFNACFFRYSFKKLREFSNISSQFFCWKFYPQISIMKHKALKHIHTPYKIPAISSPQNPYRQSAPMVGTQSTKSLKLCGLPTLNSSSNIDGVAKTLSRVNSRVLRSSRDVALEKNDGILDQFLLSTLNMPLHKCVETVFQNELNARDVIFWQDIPSLHTLVSKRLEITVSHSEALVGFTFYQRSRLILERPFEHPAYCERIDRCGEDKYMTMMLFPLYDNVGSVCGVVQVMRPKTQPFDVKAELEFVDYFSRKFSTYYKVFARPAFSDDIVIELLQYMEIEQFLMLFQKKMDQLFKCRCAEIWKYDYSTKTLQMYKKTKTEIDIGNSGIVGDAINSRYPVNCITNKMLSSYNEVIDGSDIEPVLAIPLVNTKLNVIHVVALRGGNKVVAFSAEDEANLTKMTPYIVLALSNIEKEEKFGKSSETDIRERHCFEGILDFLDATQEKHELNDMIGKLMEKMELIVRSDRATLYTLDRSTMQLKTMFCTGKNVPIVNPADQTIPSKVLASGNVYNIADADNDIEFDSSIDLETNYKTKTILAVPVFNCSSDVIGVCEFLNRIDGKPFPHSDINFIRILTSFCGMVLDNRQLHEEISSSEKKLRDVLDVSLSIMSDLGLQSTYRDILTMLNQKMQCDRSAVYLLNDAKDNLVSLVSAGDPLQLTLNMSMGIAPLACSSKDILISNDARHDTRIVKDPLDLSGIVLDSVLVAPIITSDGDVLGVFEIANKKEAFSPEDISLARSFSLFVSICLEKRELNTISDHGNAEFEMTRWIEPTERIECAIPASMSIVTAKKIDVETTRYNPLQFEGIDLFRVVFFVFDQFKFFSLFEIHADTLFGFLYKLREIYPTRIYHNFQRAVDILQFVSYQIRISKIDKRLNSAELLALCIASLCIDLINEDNTDKLDYYEILFDKPKKVQDPALKLCKFLINMMGNNKINIFRNMGIEDMKTMWKTVMKLLSGARMSNHFKLIEMANNYMKNRDDAEWGNPKIRLIALTLVLKSGLVAFMCRSNQICETVYSKIAEEVSPEVDDNKDNELIESPLRLAKLKIDNKIREQIGFAAIVAMPILKAASKMIRPLITNYELAEVNFEKWKSCFFDYESIPQSTT
ncbi:3'5'-cyclic nucleotide phosphodiesterase family protein [Tritrichomonas foetus]|uniref:3'5'-cyclic nucleotide phosphodiesterase family protein n=1 Tax=Tritrichomonas foetus TaxID=1144522 RepID=A0A1J4KW33_9EUKA|nr:3'5'-cyclic nucleotide phosphodiesterase family protein [Tritrichomonas foetus]|eukprot:OHT15439.1 3'5'-cyclic nucleotide phosphodiesterase family protein [Tritrichomonas foetus]